MASIQRLLRSFFSQKGYFQDFKTENVVNTLKKYRLHLVSAVATCSTLYLLHRINQKKNLEIHTAIKRRTTEKRFIGFASAVYNGQLFMTPLDFLEAVLEMDPRKRHSRKRLTEKDLKRIHETTPRVSEGSPRFFRDLRNEGIMSYSEYLFLMSILTKPQSAFEICFKMLDTDLSGTVDKDEFLVMERIFGQHSKLRRGEESTSSESKTHSDHLVDDEDGLQSKEQIDTTLIVHFFGPDGTDELSFEHFKKFMLDLQREALELEFMQYSHGLSIVSEVDFAKILLKYTYLEQDEYDEYIDRLLERIEEDDEAHPGITFDEYSSFMEFLHNLNEFNLIMKFYTLVNTQATEFEFREAVQICTGIQFTSNLVKTIFNLFDVDGDGNLSYKEFNFIMKDRMTRGVGFDSKRGSFRAFKQCVRREMLRQHTASFYQGNDAEN